MHAFLTKGLDSTAALWADVEQGYAWVHRAAHLLSNDEQHPAAQVSQAYETLLAEMEHTPTSSHADLPRTNNALEQYFGSARHHERRASGRKQASPGVVIRGAVRVVASVASRLHPFSESELCPTDLTRWRTLRSELNHRHEARRLQYRFRKSPERYLADLEEKLSKERLPP
jgi:hypothetical protein